ncbi:hypothetical protein ERD78_14165 [Allopusillimonas soli]|uniref:Uncharacterized protein n=1 Tax=Allopusillimonas soli TaxID=659016 RepID=A0A853FD75_9BURK|nr:hypothetical protein [Allopusillimonas soli]NYT38023.1 hypothetical protein [Allopusillimonas soli]TEA73915.1 hypothetical protein ERD78_14165 [Allopusillimonas soli]
MHTDTTCQSPDADRVGVLPRLGIFLSSLLVLGNYYYLYFVPFDQGSTNEPWTYSLLKPVGIMLLYCFLLSSKLKHNYRFHQVLFLLFFFYSFCAILLKRFAWDSGGLMFFNMVICALPLFVLVPRKQAIISFFETCLLIISAQVIIDYAIYINGYSLWNNKAFIGGLGNPSSFGFVCDVLIAYILHYRKYKTSSLIFFLILSYGVIKSNAMLAVLVYAALMISWGTKRLGLGFLFLCAIIGTSLAIFSHDILSRHLIYKLDSVLALFDDNISASSISVSLRVQMHMYLLEQLRDNFFSVLFFGYPERYYYAADSQYLTYIGSFGLMASMIFFLATALALAHSYVHRRELSSFSWVAIIMFMLVFFTNRLLDYYPVALFLFLAMAVGTTSTKSRRPVPVLSTQPRPA